MKEKKEKVLKKEKAKNKQEFNINKYRYMNE